MVLLALGLSSITAPATEAVMGSVADDQRGAAAGVNNTTRELGGTLGVAVFGSVFASSYAPKIIRAFRPLPIPAGPKAEAHQSMAAALAVVHRAPHACGRRWSPSSSRLPQRPAGGLHRRRRGGRGRCAGGVQAPARAGGAGGGAGGGAHARRGRRLRTGRRRIGRRAAPATGRTASPERRALSSA